MADKVVGIFGALWSGPLPGLAGPHEVTLASHRVVHGGEVYRAAVKIDEGVEREIERLGAFAPLHNPPQLSAIRAARGVCPEATHVAVFDTAFHRTLAPEAFTYAGPRVWRDQGIRRFGFHGSSFRYADRRAREMLGRETDGAFRNVVCHLGGGCSLSAIRGGESVDTTMGFTPLDGICMCTRSGGVDPGILIYLLRQGASADELERVLNKESGLAGLSGLPGDTRVLCPAAAEGNADARLALGVFVHRLQRGIGAMIAALGGLDALTFTDVIGQTEPDLRAQACRPFTNFGLALDARRNARARDDAVVSEEGSRVAVLTVRAREDWQLAVEAFEVNQP